jgi:rhodanese-related sulfurtransferase
MQIPTFTSHVLRELLTIVVLALPLAAWAGGAGPITRGELASRIESGSAPVVLDVRTHEEFLEGHIPGAVNIPLRELSRRLAEIDGLRANEVVLHCETGPRAGYADQILRGAGFTGLRALDGHMRAWREAGMAVTPRGCATC